MSLKQNRSTFTFLVIILVLSCVVIALGVTAVGLFIRNPLGEKMSLVLGTPTAESAQASPTPSTSLDTMEQSATPTPAELPTEPVVPTSTPAQAILPVISSGGTCGGSGSVLLLFIGADFSGGNPPPGADSVRVVKVDFDHEQVTIVAFPRDLWVQTPALANQNITATRLGLSYDYKKNTTMGDPKHKVTAATTLVGQTLYDNFGLTPETYLTIQMQTMPAMVDTIGGVDINNPTAFVSERNMYYPQGAQHLNGDQSKEYVRTFLPGGDTARRQRQDLFVKSLQTEVLSAGIVTKIPALAVQFDQAIVTDLTPEQIGRFSCMVQAVPQDQVLFYEVSGDLVTVQNIGQGIPVLMPKTEEIKVKLNEWLGE
jgi:LCP family protein required for cell wall assembly